MSLLDELLLPPNEAQAEAIKSSIGEDEDRFKNNLLLFEKWVSFQPHLPQNYERNMLSVFLRGCKHDMEEAKRKIELFFLCRLTIPEFFCDRDLTAPSMQSTVNNVQCVVMPKLTPQGNRITFFKLKTSDITQFDMALACKFIWTYGDLRACKEKLTCGDVYVFDCTNFTPAHAAKFVSPLLKKALFVSQDAFATRIREMHVINAPGYIERVVAFVKLGLKEKLRERFSVHKGTETLSEFVPEKCLPNEYGGSGGSMEEINNKWIKCLKEHKDWFKEQESVKCLGEIPTKLKDKSRSFEETIGVQGSFRKLTID